MVTIKPTTTTTIVDSCVPIPIPGAKHIATTTTTTIPKEQLTSAAIITPNASNTTVATMVTKPSPEAVQLRKEILEPWYNHYVKLKDTCHGYLAEDYIMQTIRLIYPSYPGDKLVTMCSTLRKMFLYASPPYNRKIPIDIFNTMRMKLYCDILMRSITDIKVGAIQSLSDRDLCAGYAVKCDTEEKRVIVIPTDQQQQQQQSETITKKRKSPPRHTDSEVEEIEVEQTFQKALQAKKRIKKWTQEADALEIELKELRSKIASAQENFVDLVDTMSASLLKQE